MDPYNEQTDPCSKATTSPNTQIDGELLNPCVLHFRLRNPHQKLFSFPSYNKWPFGFRVEREREREREQAYNWDKHAIESMNASN